MGSLCRVLGNVTPSARCVAYVSAYVLNAFTSSFGSNKGDSDVARVDTTIEGVPPTGYIITQYACMWPAAFSGYHIDGPGPANSRVTPSNESSYDCATTVTYEGFTVTENSSGTDSMSKRAYKLAGVYTRSAAADQTHRRSSM
jgi:hypothetical protein